MPQNQIADSLSNLSVMQLCELTRELETRWGVTAAPPVALPMPGSPVPLVRDEQEQYEFTVELTSVGTNKIGAIKVIREILGLGLLESKNLVEGAPKVIKSEVSKADADEIRAKLAVVGAVATIR